MKCDTCSAPIPEGEAAEHNGRTLCEDCYMDALSPPRACDPWAVYTAKSFSSTQQPLTATQKKILRTLRETGGVEPIVLAEMLNMTIRELEREFATLRHMEKARGEMRDGKKVLCLW